MRVTCPYGIQLSLAHSFLHVLIYWLVLLTLTPLRENGCENHEDRPPGDLNREPLAQQPYDPV